MRRWCVAAICALTLGWSNPSVANEASGASPLTLAEVLGSTERSFPLLQAAELERAIAAAEVLSAEGGFDVAWKTKGTIIPVGYYESRRVESVIEQPTALWGASAFAGWKYGRGDFAVYDGDKETLEYGEVKAGVNVPLWRNGPTDRRRASLERAELGRDIAGLSVDEQRIQARRSAAHRYWAWVAAGERVHIAEELLENVLERDTALAARVAEGDLAPIERTENARVIEQRKAQVAQATRGLEQATIDLSLFLRSSAGEPILAHRARLPEGLPEPREPSSGRVPTADVSAALSRRPEPKKYALQVRQNEVEKEYASNQLAPGVDVQVAGSQDLGPAMPSRPDLSDPVLEVSVLIDVPLQARAARGRRDAATAAIGRLRHQERYAKDRVEADVRDAHSAIKAAIGRVEAARREVLLAEELEAAERVRFEQGDSTLLIVYLREQQTAEAELREIDGLLDYQRALADLKAARGE